MKLSLQYEMQRSALDDRLVLAETMEQCILADEVGFDYLWFVEHHFLTGFSASPCPDLVYAALSQRTKRIRLGLGVVILPYHHPSRVAERVAMLDHLSEGRVDFGTGRSAVYELTGMGIDARDSRDMWEESLTMIPKIWESDWFSWEGRFWSVPSRQVLPAPARHLRDRRQERHRGLGPGRQRTRGPGTPCSQIQGRGPAGRAGRRLRQRQLVQRHPWRVPRGQ